MKRAWMLGLSVALVIGPSGVVNAALTVIGTASYDSDGNGTAEDYKMIYLDDGPFGPITWLDYTKIADNWQNQVSWASGLGGNLTVNLDPVYTSTIDWSTGWRLPETADGSYVYGYDGTTTAGYNITTSEMGYLFYEALGNKGYYDTSGNGPQSGWGLQNTFDFDNLLADFYWSGTEYSPNPHSAWDFYFGYGYQGNYDKSSHNYALAVRPGDVSAVPVPGTVLLLASGLAGLGALGRERRRRRR